MESDDEDLAMSHDQYNLFLKVVGLIRSERVRQDRKWGYPQDKSLTTWSTVLGEEYGEVCEAILDAMYAEKPFEDVVAETVQVAAVAVAMIEHWVLEGSLQL